MSHMNLDRPTSSATAVTTVTTVTVNRRLSRALRWLFAAIGQRYQVWQDIRTLEGLDDRTLKDIGLHRSEVEWVRRSSRWDVDLNRDL